VLLGASVFGILDPHDRVMHALSELGVLILLFEIGLHTDLKSLARVGGAAATVGLVGVALPFVFGYYAAVALGVDALPAIVCGAALTATSIGISARVLADLGQLESKEGQVVLGAAVLDDVVGLIILSVVSGLAEGGELHPLEIVRITLVAIGFVVAALVIGRIVAPPAFRGVDKLERMGGVLGPIALAFALLLAYLADRAGSAMIIGAFAAGLVLHGTPQRAAIEKSITGLGHYLVPIFFAVVGASVDLLSLASGSILAIGGALVVVGIVTKVAAGYAPWWFRGRKLMIGVAMVPRGEVGLIFAQVGLTTGVLSVQLFSAITLMVMITTFIAPPVLSRLSRAPGAKPDRDASGAADLVSGPGKS
jgi:Kef-type K+ transport system membrane component KefB